MIVGHTDTSVGFSSTSFGAVPDNYSWSVASNFPQFKPNFTFWEDRSLFVFFGGKCVRNKIRENNSCVSALPGFKAEYICLTKMENSVGNDVRFLTSKWLPFAIPAGGIFNHPPRSTCSENYNASLKWTGHVSLPIIYQTSGFIA